MYVPEKFAHFMYSVAKQASRTIIGGFEREKVLEQFRIAFHNKGKIERSQSPGSSHTDEWIITEEDFEVENFAESSRKRQRKNSSDSNKDSSFYKGMPDHN